MGAGAHIVKLDNLGVTAVIGCNASGEKLEDALRATGHKIGFAFRSDNNGTLQALVAANFGVALIPLLAVSRGEEDGTKVVRPVPPLPPRRLAVAWHRDRQETAAAAAFIEAAKNASAEIERDIGALLERNEPLRSSPNGAVESGAQTRRG